METVPVDSKVLKGIHWLTWEPQSTGWEVPRLVLQEPGEKREKIKIIIVISSVFILTTTTQTFIVSQAIFLFPIYC